MLAATSRKITVWSRDYNEAQGVPLDTLLSSNIMMAMPQIIRTSSLGG